MARLRSLLALLAAVAMTGTLLTGAASAAAPPRSTALRSAPPLTALSQSIPAQSGGSGAAGSTGTGSTGAVSGTSGTATFGIQPASPKGADNRDSFAYSATPGAVKTDYVAIANYSAAPLQLHLYATDAYNTADGAFTVLPSSQKATDIGLWVTFTQQFITIPAKSTAIMPFILHVPVNASPGDHSGGIVVSLTTMTYDAKGSQVAVESRVGTRLAVRVPGTLRAAVTVSAVSVTYHNTFNPFGDGSATVSYKVNNTGNVRLAGTQTVRITSLFGGSVLSAPIAPIKELLPGNSIRVTTQVGGVLPSFSSTVRITVAPSAYPGDTDPKASTVVQDASVLTIPWSLIVLILLLIAAGFLLWRRWRFYRAPVAGGAAPSKGAVSKGPAPKVPGGPGSKPSPKAGAAKPRVNVPAPKKVTAPAPKPKSAAAPKTGAPTSGAKPVQP